MLGWRTDISGVNENMMSGESGSWFTELNSWGYLDDGLGQRFAQHWPVEMQNQLSAVQQVSV